MFISPAESPQPTEGSRTLPFRHHVVRAFDSNPDQPTALTTDNLARGIFRRMMWLESIPESYSADPARVEARLQDTLCGKVAMLAGAHYFQRLKLTIFPR